MMGANRGFLALLALCCGIMGTVEALEDGGFYKILNPETGKVLTVGTNSPVDGANIILSDWQNQPNQKWLAVEAGVAVDSYLLLTQQQRWIWSHFIRNGESLRETKDRHDSLPDWSLVLNGDSKGQVALKPRDSKKYQQWKSESTSSFGRIIIKNVQENKCLEAAGVEGTVPGDSGSTEKPGFFRRIRNWFGNLFGRGGSSTSSTTTNSTAAAVTPNNNTVTPLKSKTYPATVKVGLASCDKTKAAQQFTLESLDYRTA